VKARILIVDDHEIVRKGICKLIEDSGHAWEICGEAASGSEAIALAVSLNPDVIVLDIAMPTLSGFEAASRIAGLGLNCRTLLFTMYESKRLGAESRRAGAHGYVLKSQAARYLVVAVERLLAGGTFFGSPEGEAHLQSDTPPDNGRVYCLDLSFGVV